jgi:hypothetical protein
MHIPRSEHELSPLARRLAASGIVAVPDVFSVAQLAKLNTAMDPILAAKTNERRAYVRPDEMLAAGILDLALSRRMRELLFSVIPDPVLYHLHAYEIAGRNPAPHVFSEKPAGWHSDPDSVFHRGDPTHVSIFVYLSDVDAEDGPFEFCLHQPDTPPRADSPVISMTGPAGFSFAWNRSYYHRAAPNRGTRRRRLLKISIQPNAFPSYHLQSPPFQAVIRATPPGDVEMDLLLGRNQGRAAPRRTPGTAPRVLEVKPRGVLGPPGDVLTCLTGGGGARAIEADYD